MKTAVQPQAAHGVLKQQRADEAAQLGAAAGRQRGVGAPDDLGDLEFEFKCEAGRR
jgi:hypothetical protein